jgi:hypothetical protein
MKLYNKDHRINKYILSKIKIGLESYFSIVDDYLTNNIDANKDQYHLIRNLSNSLSCGLHYIKSLNVLIEPCISKKGVE